VSFEFNLSVTADSLQAGDSKMAMRIRVVAVIAIIAATMPWGIVHAQSRSVAWKYGTITLMRNSENPDGGYFMLQDERHRLGMPPIMM